MGGVIPSFVPSHNSPHLVTYLTSQDVIEVYIGSSMNVINHEFDWLWRIKIILTLDGETFHDKNDVSIAVKYNILLGMWRQKDTENNIHLVWFVSYYYIIYVVVWRGVFPAKIWRQTMNSVKRDFYSERRTIDRVLIWLYMCVRIFYIIYFDTR